MPSVGKPWLDKLSTWSNSLLLSESKQKPIESYPCLRAISFSRVCCWSESIRLILWTITLSPTGEILTAFIVMLSAACEKQGSDKATPKISQSNRNTYTSYGVARIFESKQANYLRKLPSCPENFLEGKIILVMCYKASWSANIKNPWILTLCWHKYL